MHDIQQLDYELSISIPCYSSPLNFPGSSLVKTDHVVRAVISIDRFHCHVVNKINGKPFSG